MKALYRSALFGAAVSGAVLWQTTALACGGFFCNQSQPVNQAAENIIFVDNGDGTTTAVIQIQYQGPAESFSWLLPLSSVPEADTDIGIASNLALQRLQSATNPRYTLTTRVEGTCRGDLDSGKAGPTRGGGISVNPNAPEVDSDDGGVTVEASGTVGAFEWTVISLDPALAEPADAAVEWLSANGYDVPSGSPALLGPYLEDGMYLLALRLTKGADTGSIRPIVLTYEGSEASIPVKLTAVAANDDMGVLTWMLGESRAVPANYLSLELNEARINWFNAASTYNSVVIEAADDAGGQGFVTEFAGSTSAFASVVWTQSDEQTWSIFNSQVFSSFEQLFNQAYNIYGFWDGFWDATRNAVTLPEGLAFEDFKLCPDCYAASITFAPSTFLAELDANVIQPVKLVQDLIDAHPTLTRLYTTLSAEEMTLDPIFTFNADLDEVSNQHTAERVIECNPSVFQSEAPWRIELTNGDVVRGTAADAQSQTWPSALDAMPPNSRIVRTSASGSGKVVEDNAAPISEQLAEYNATVPKGGGASDDSSCAVAAPRSRVTELIAVLMMAAALLRRYAGRATP